MTLSIEEFSTLHRIQIVPLVLKGKDYIYTSDFIEGSKNPKYNNWKTNSIIYHDYMNKEYIRNLYKKYVDENEGTELVWAMDTRQMHVIDIDDKKYLDDERIQQMMKEGMYFYSLRRRLPKILIRSDNENVKYFKKDNNKYFEDGDLEVQSGQWTYVKMKEVVINSMTDLFDNVKKMRNVFELFKSFEFKLQDEYVKEKRNEERMKRREEKNEERMKRREEKNEEIMKMKKEEKQNHLEKKKQEKKEKMEELFKEDEIDLNQDIITKERIEKLVDEIEDEEAKGYNTWNTFRFCLKGFCEEKGDDEWGRKTFHIFSKKCPTKYNKNEVDREWDRDNFGEYYVGYFINLTIKYDLNIFREEESKIIKIVNNQMEDKNMKEFVSIFMRYITEEDKMELYKECKTLNTFIRKLLKKTIDKIDTESVECKTMFSFSIYHIFKYFVFDYELTKKIIQLQCFKIQHPEGYGIYTIDKGLEYITMNSLRHIRYYNDEDDNGQFVYKWQNDNRIRIYDTYSFNPSTKCHSNKMFNTYNGLRAEKFNYIDTELVVPPPTYQNQEHLVCPIEIIQEYILTKLCGGHLEFKEYFLNYLSHLVQKPHIKTQINIILKGVEGSGKGQFMNFFGNGILGNEYYLSTADSDRILAKFNSYIERIILINWDEVSGKTTFDKTDDIKKFITDDSLCCESKGKEMRISKNYVNFISTTNNDAPYTIGSRDRRYVGVESKVDRMTNEEGIYYSELLHIDNVNVVKSFYDYLMNRDISKVNLRTRVETDFYLECKKSSLSTSIQYLGYMINNEIDDVFYFPINESGFMTIKKQKLYEKYKNWMQTYNRRSIEVSFETFCKQIKKEIIHITNGGRDRKDGDKQTYTFRETELKQELKEKGIEFD